MVYFDWSMKKKIVCFFWYKKGVTLPSSHHNHAHQANNMSTVKTRRSLAFEKVPDKSQHDEETDDGSTNDDTDDNKSADDHGDEANDMDDDNATDITTTVKRHKRKFSGFKPGIVSLRSIRKFKRRIVSLAKETPFSQAIDDISSLLEDDDVLQLHIKALTEFSKEAETIFNKLVGVMEASYKHADIVVKNK